MTHLHYGSLCSGIEAATQAWHPLGWTPAFFSEVAPFPSAVLAHHYPHVPNLGDMTRFEDWPDHAIDLLVGGTPCQSFSVAGLRKGLADPRGNLMLTFGGVARRYRPRWVLWENVPGVLSSSGGRDFGTLLGMLAELGYGFAYRILDAQFVRTCRHAGAVPQRRRRVFVVGHLGDWRRAAAVLFDAESLSGHPPPRRQAGEGAAPTISARPTGGGGLGTDFDLDGGLIANSGDVGYFLTASAQQSLDAETETLIAVAHALRGEGHDASEDGTGRGTPIVPIAFDCKGSEVQVCIDGSNPTLRSMGHNDSHQNAGGHAAVATPWAVRRLTPQECERLQGFPDDFTRIPGASKGGWREVDPAEDIDELREAGMPLRLAGNAWMVKDPDGPRYKALGNSMAVNVMTWLGERIALVEGAA